MISHWNLHLLGDVPLPRLGTGGYFKRAVANSQTSDHFRFQGIVIIFPMAINVINLRLHSIFGEIHTGKSHVILLNWMVYNAPVDCVSTKLLMVSLWFVLWRHVCLIKNPLKKTTFIKFHQSAGKFPTAHWNPKSIVHLFDGWDYSHQQVQYLGMICPLNSQK